MGFNKIPLALKFDDATGNSTGLKEFTLNLSDVGDVCTTAPTEGQLLGYDGDRWCVTSITTGGGGGGGASVTGVPTGNLGQIVTYASLNTPQALSPTATPLSLATTGIVETQIQDSLVVYATTALVSTTSGELVPRTGPVNVVGPITFTTNEPQFPVGLNVTGPAVFTGVVSFTEKPKVAGNDIVINSDLAAYATNANLTTTGAALITTQAALAATGAALVTTQDALAATGALLATALQKPSTAGAGAGDLLLYNAGNNTATTSVADFIADQDLVVESDLNAYATTAFTDSKYNTTATFFATTATLATNANLSLTAAAAVQVADTTANSRTFLGTNANIQNLNNVDFDDITTPQILVRTGSKVFASSLNIGGSNFLFNEDGLGGGEIDFTPSSASTDSALVIANVSADNLNVFRTGQMNPTCYIHESDWLAAGTSPNGFGQSNAGTGAGTGQCFDNDVMHPDKGTIGVFEIRSGTDAFGRCFVTTFNNALAVSSCSVSFTSRIAPSGLWVNGSNEGKMCFGIRNGTSNAAATYAMEFQYGAGGGETNTTWSAVVTDNSNSTVSDTGVVVSAQEFNVLQVSCNQDWSEVDFYVDGVNKAQFSLAAGHKIPDSRFNRLGLAWAINNANIFSTSNTTDGNEIFVDWHQYRLKATTRVSGNRGKDLIQ
tara:strand:- start:4835 stop:6826 length:1992 start_codon:yes stop_codon:yes gene_type:complete